MQFHGAPDTAHDWVSTSRDNFAAYMKYLAVNNFRVVALRDLANYVDAKAVPQDSQKIIKERQAALAESAGK